MRLLDDAFLNELCSRFSRNDRYLIGVSGGRDSMVLLHLLHSLGFDHLIVCHVNHQLRGADSDADEVFVQKQSSDFGYRFFSHQENVKVTAKEQRLSLETAARNVRHEFFFKIATETGCSRLLLAHHSDDQVETVLMNLFRGTGLKGLGGMRFDSVLKSEDGSSLEILRPLLEISRSEIDNFVEMHSVTFREDESNTELFALRNRLRQNLIPTINDVFERDVRSSVLRLSETARLDSDDAILETERLYRAAFVADENGSLSVASLRSVSESKRRRLILHWLQQRKVGNCGYEEAKRISEMVLRDENPAKVNLPGSRFARRRAGLLFLEGELA